MKQAVHRDVGNQFVELTCQTVRLEQVFPLLAYQIDSSPDLAESVLNILIVTQQPLLDLLFHTVARNGG